MERHNTAKPLLTIAATAREYGMSTYWLRQQYRAGKLPHIKCGVKILVDTELLLQQIHGEAGQAVRPIK